MIPFLACSFLFNITTISLCSMQLREWILEVFKIEMSGVERRKTWTTSDEPRFFFFSPKGLGGALEQRIKKFLQQKNKYFFLEDLATNIG